MGVSIAITYEEASGNSLALEVNITRHKLFGSRLASNEFTIGSEGGGSVLFQMMVHEINNEPELLVKLTKKEPDDELVYVIDFNQRYRNNKIHRTLTTDDSQWRVIDQSLEVPNHGYDFSNSLTINVSLKVTVASYSKRDVPKTISHIASLHEDTELTDFELRGEDGSVHLHKAIAAAASPVLRRMFAGDWRETAEGVVEVPDTTKATLQQFKDYIYLDTIPDSGVEQLLLLAKCYMMEDLEQRCVDKLRVDVTEETAHHLISFAIRHHLDKLLLAILYQLKQSSFNLEDMKTSLDLNKK